MPSADQNPYPYGRIVISYGTWKTIGAVAGFDIRFVKMILRTGTPELNLPENAVARVTTIDPTDPVWQKEPAPAEHSLLTFPTEKGAVLLQVAAKDVSDDYVVCKADLCLEFRNP